MFCFAGTYLVSTRCWIANYPAAKRAGFMKDADAESLKLAVENMHNCRASLKQSVPVREKFVRQTVWEGVVHVFELKGHPTATQAYAWSSPIEGSDKRRFFAVLHQPPVTSPVEAVRAAIVAEQRAGKAT